MSNEEEVQPPMNVHILYENPDWMPPLRRELERAELPYEEWFIHTGSFDLGQEPPEGVFLNRISPSGGCPMQRCNA